MAPLFFSPTGPPFPLKAPGKTHQCFLGTNSPNVSTQKLASFIFFAPKLSLFPCGEFRSDVPPLKLKILKRTFHIIHSLLLKCWRSSKHFVLPEIIFCVLMAFNCKTGVIGNTRHSVPAVWQCCYRVVPPAPSLLHICMTLSSYRIYKAFIHQCLSVSEQDSSLSLSLSFLSLMMIACGPHLRNHVTC